MSNQAEQVSVSNPVELPLSAALLKSLEDPELLDDETIFYIFYSDIYSSKHMYQMGEKLAYLGAMAVAGPTAGEALNSLRTGIILGRIAGLRDPKEIFWEEDELDAEKVKRGRTLLQEVIYTSELLSQIWALFKSLLMVKFRQDWKTNGEIDSFVMDRENNDPEVKQLRLDHAKVTVELAKYDEEVLRHTRDKIKPIWNQGKAAPSNDLTHVLDSYNQKNKDKITSLREAAAKAETEVKDRYRQILEKTKNAEPKKEKKGKVTIMATKDNESTDLATTDKKPQKKVEFKNVSVMYVDDPNSPKISLPKGMTYGQAREWLTKIETEENRKFAFNYKFKGWYPFDAMWAVYRSLAEMYGFVHVQDFKTMFGPVPPASFTIETAYNKKQQIPWGPIEVHGLSAPLVPGIDFDQGLPCLTLSAEIKNHERSKVDELMEASERLLQSDSIYRGKAVEIDFTIFNPRDIRFDVARSPKFMDTNVKETDLILPSDVRDLVEVGMWTPIRNTEVCREQKIPLRRGILLAGKYGVGKTLAARVTAMLCEKNNWTFLYLKDLEQLPQALYFAKRYEPCVVFAEDINRVVSGDRTQEMDKLFNVVDGIDRKNDEVMIIFTTNDIDQIHPGMLRPGRIDAVITVTPPDAEAASNLVRHYGRTIVDPTADLTKVGQLLAGQIPAIIRESVERSKLAAIKDTKPGQKLVVREAHLLVAAKQLLEHAKLLEEPPPAPTNLEKGLTALGGMLADAIRFRGQATDEEHDKAGDPAVDKRLAERAVEEALSESNGSHRA